MSKVELMGFYYRDDKDDGVSIVFGKTMGMPQSLVDKCYNEYSKCVKAEISEFAKGNYSYFHGATSKQEAIDNIMGYLKQEIVAFNHIVFGSEVRPPKAFYQSQITPDRLRVSMAIATNIWLLTQIGVIPQDTYNGTQFIYKGKGVTGMSPMFDSIRPKTQADKDAMSKAEAKRKAKAEKRRKQMGRG